MKIQIMKHIKLVFKFKLIIAKCIGRQTTQTVQKEVKYRQRDNSEIKLSYKVKKSD